MFFGWFSYSGKPTVVVLSYFLGKNKQDTSQKGCRGHGIWAGYLILVSLLLLCFSSSMKSGPGDKNTQTLILPFYNNNE